MIEVKAKTISELKRLAHQMKIKFIKDNSENLHNPSSLYKQFEKNINELVNEEVKIFLKDKYFCDKCVEKDHELEFCRCVSRNMKIARLEREPIRENN